MALYCNRKGSYICAAFVPNQRITCHEGKAPKRARDRWSESHSEAGVADSKRCHHELRKAQRPRQPHGNRHRLYSVLPKLILTASDSSFSLLVKVKSQSGRNLLFFVCVLAYVCEHVHAIACVWQSVDSSSFSPPCEVILTCRWSPSLSLLPGPTPNCCFPDISSPPQHLPELCFPSQPSPHSLLFELLPHFLTVLLRHFLLSFLCSELRLHEAALVAAP